MNFMIVLCVTLKLFFLGFVPLLVLAPNPGDATALVYNINISAAAVGLVVIRGVKLRTLYAGLFSMTCSIDRNLCFRVTRKCIGLSD